jgi:glycosyltransferase involved in cell wall biosynthesis
MVVGAYYPELAGGSLQCRTLIRALRDRVQFSVLTTTRDRTLPAVSDVDGVLVRRVFVAPERRLTKIAAAVQLLRRARAIARDHDVIHFHGFTEKMLALLPIAKAARLRTIEKMTSLGWDDPIAIRSRPGGWMLAAAQARVDRFVCISSAMRERCRAAGIPDHRVVEIPNGVDTARFMPVDAATRAAIRTRLGVPIDATVVTFVGFWSEEKGPARLFDAWLRAQTPNDVLLFIGSTAPEHDEVDRGHVERVRARIAADRLDARVRFVERTEDVAAYLQASDVFALPSSREGLSNALLEAMATALPCVAGRIPGVSDDVIEDGVNGFVVAPDDPSALAGVLARLKSESLRATVGARARATILERFSLPMVADRYFTLYSELAPGA